MSTDNKDLKQEEIKEDIKTDAEASAKEEKAPKKDKKAKKQEAAPAEEVQAEVVEVKIPDDRYLRLMAEYDNYRKRSQKEKESLYADVKADTAAKFLPVYDNLARALSQPTADEAYRKGVELIMNQFMATLEKLGISKVESLGQSFDPELHNAVMHVDDEEKGENEIVEVFQEGFKLGEKVIRFAMVKVAN